jgi:hypothetical protein
MSWKGTLALLILAATAAFLLLGRAHPHRPPGASLLDLDPERVERIVIRDAGGETVLAKLDGIWFVRSGTPDRADASLVRLMLSTALETVPLDTLPPSELKGPVSLEALDLKVPRRSLTLTSGNRSETLSFGVEGAGKGRVYARLEGEAPVHLVSTAISDLAFRPAAAFRDTRLTALRPDAPETITLLGPGTGGRQVILSRKGQKGREWTVGDSPERMGRADRTSVERFTEALLGARILGWLPSGAPASACGLDSSEAVFSISTGGELPPVTITFGKALEGGSGERYATCSDRQGICVLKDIVKDFKGGLASVSPDILRDRHPAPVEADSVDRIEIFTGAETVPGILLQRKKGTDDWESPGNQVTVPGHEIAGWISRLNGVTAERFQSSGEIDPRPAGNSARIRLIAHLSENTAEEGAGDVILSEISLAHLEGPEATLSEKGNPSVMLLEASPLRALIGEASGWTGTAVPSAAQTASPQASPSPQSPKKQR